MSFNLAQSGEEKEKIPLSREGNFRLHSTPSNYLSFYSSVLTREKHKASCTPDGWLVSPWVSVTLIDLTPSIRRCKRLSFARFTSRGVKRTGAKAANWV